MIRLSNGFTAVALTGILALSTSLSKSDAKEPPLAGASKSKGLAQQIIGTWQLEEATTPGTPSGIGTRLKLFTGSHWSVIQPDPKSGLIVFQHGGRYEIKGKKMKVNRDFAGESTKGMIGGTGTYKIKIEGDVMKQADSDGVFNETWKRVK